MKMWKQKTWQWESTGVDGSAALFGVNIFDYPWERVGPPGTRVIVHDPDGRERKMPVYRVTIDGQQHEFAAGEVSNCVYSFYLEQY